MEYRKYIAALPLVLVVGLAVYYVSARRGADGASGNDRLAEARSLRYSLERIEPLSDSLTAQLLHPGGMKIDDGSIYVVDWGVFKIKRFDKQGRLANMIGEGKGRGPGEFALLGEFDLGEENLWVIDPDARSVLHFDKSSSKYVDQFTLDGFGHRIASADGQIAVLQLHGDLFYIYDRQGNLVKNFGKLIDDQYSNPLAVDGHLAAGGGGEGFVYQPSYASYLYAVGDTAVLDTARTVDKRDYPAAVRPSANRLSAPTPPIRYGDVSVSDGRVYVLANADSVAEGRRKGVKYSYLDVYARETFEYEGSARLPRPTRIIEVRNDTLYAIADADTLFTAYKIERR